jgi:hypothetical protein
MKGVEGSCRHTQKMWQQQRPKFLSFLGSSSNLRKAPISLGMFDCPSVRPHLSTRPPGEWFSWDLTLAIRIKFWPKIQIWLESDNIFGHFTGRPEYVYIVDCSKKCYVYKQNCKRAHCCVSMARINNFMLLSVTCVWTVQMLHTVTFCRQDVEYF